MVFEFRDLNRAFKDSFILSIETHNHQRKKFIIFVYFEFIFTNKSEPVGSKAPTFSTELKSGTFVKQMGHDFALLCQAQGFPVVIFR